ncbi:MAG: DUF4974 domain-containing protein [Agriterribacter sp.]
MDKQEIRLLAERFLQGMATDEEKALLHQWYDTWEDEPETVMLEEPAQSDDIRKKILQELKKSIHTDTSLAPPIKSVTTKRWLIAASLLILVLGGGYFLYRPSTAKQSIASSGEPVKHDAAPGGNKAVLTLADGSKIVLDSAQNGNLAQQGSTKILKEKDGQLVYDLGKNAPMTTEVLYNTISTPRGGQYQLILPDGSKVWLNAASSLRYPTVFTGNERKIELTGEAYFEIEHMTATTGIKVPFIVSVKNMAVKVLGTHFNINAYEDEEDIKTTLLSGSVDVAAIQNNGQSLRLYPGQQAQWSTKSIMTLVKNADVEQAVAWKNGLFKFNATSLSTIMRQVARWYDVDIDYRGNVKEETFTGDIPRKQYASEVFKMLEMTKTVKFQIENKNVIIEPMKNNDTGSK